MILEGLFIKTALSLYHLVQAKVHLLIAKMLALFFPALILAIALNSIDIKPEVRHALYGLWHIKSPSTTVTIFSALSWTIYELGKRAINRRRIYVGLLPLVTLGVGITLSVVPSLPSPWTYMLVIATYWLSFIATVAFYSRLPILWLFGFSKPRAH